MLKGLYAMANNSNPDNSATRLVEESEVLCWNFQLTEERNKEPISYIGQVHGTSETDALANLKKNHPHGTNVVVKFSGMTWKQFLSWGDRYGWD
jgi:hypothetical protein